MPAPRVILFTAFEPSGDALAAAMIAQLKQDDPELIIHALGGPKMRDAGADLIEETTHHAKMSLGAASEAGVHLKRLGRLKTWLRQHPIDALIPVDSPAANWSICGRVRETCPRAKVVHLVCPQVWAWATWRVRKLKRLTDRVLCLLPFEIEFLQGHGIPCAFVGHPVFESGDTAPPEGLEAEDGAIKLAILPGSRPKEVAVNYPTMLEALRLLRGRGHTMAAALGASDERRAKQIDEMTQADDRVAVRCGQTDRVIHWADAVLATSGTVTLQVLARQTPMVAMYNMNEFMCKYVFRWVVKTRTFTLPNLIGESMGMGRIIPEFVPHFADPIPIADALEKLITDTPEHEAQVAAFDRVAERFTSVAFAQTTSRELLDQLDAS